MTKTTNSSAPDWKSIINTLESYGDLYLVKKAPALPDNIKEVLVKLVPYFVILGLIFSFPAVLSLFGFGALSLPFFATGHGRLGLVYITSTLVLIVNLIIMAMAIPGLFSRSASAWKLMFYVSLINALHSLILFNLGNLIIGSLISFYFLFQLKSYYK